MGYDENGNILTYSRNGYGATPAMDNLTYHYQSGNNKLDHISDAVSSGNYANDLDDQSSGNYMYDSIGNLVKDQQAGITTAMTWNVYGKLLTVGNVSYQYDATGNRIGKTVGTTNTWYVRDAQGNILTTYSGTGMPMQERDLYGSSRLGIISTPGALTDTAVLLDHLGSGTLYNFTRGQKLFELSNHPGNVLATISDKKFGTPFSGTPNLISHYNADVKSAQDYYPGGMLMPGRRFGALGRYGFNGKEQDSEVKGEGAQYDYAFRIYDPRVVRFLSVDPVTRKYPYYSPYQFAGNSPIKFIDLDGLEPAQPDQSDYKGKTSYIDKPFQWTGGDAKYGSTPSTTTLGNYSTVVDKSKFIRNNTTDNKDKTFVNTTSQFLLTKENAFKNEHDLVNHLLGDFIWGKGPENVVFPHNGTFSTSLKSSTAVGYALLNWAKDGFKNSATYLWQDKLGGEMEMTSKRGLTSLEHFLGSVNVRITKTDAERVNIEVFNVTSMTSGYLPKSLPIVKWFVATPTSTVRNSGDHQLTYSNTSQYFSFDISTSEVEKLINNQQGDAGKKYTIK